MGHLTELHEKYFDKGLRVIAISPEPMGTIESRFVEGLGARYWIGSDPGRTTVARFGGGGIPHAYLIDVSGKIVTDLHPASLRDSQVEELLAQVFLPDLDRELDGALRSAVKYYEKGQVGKAWAAAARVLEHDERAVVADAQYLREKAAAWGAFRRKLAEDSIESKVFTTAIDDLKAIAKDFAGMEVAAWAAEEQKRLNADPAVARELKAWKAYLKAQAREEKAKGKAKKLAPARTAYKSIVKKYAGTRAAELADLALRRLGG